MCVCVYLSEMHILRLHLCVDDLFCVTLCIRTPPVLFFLTTAVATNGLDSQLFCEQVSFAITSCSKPPRLVRDLLTRSQNQARSNTEHKDEVTPQQDICWGMILQAGLLVLLIEILASVPLYLKSWRAWSMGWGLEISDIWQRRQR